MSLLHIFLAIFATFAWGANVPAIKIGLEEMSPLLYVALRFVCLLLMMLPWIRWRPGKMLSLIGIGLFLGPLHFGVLFLGMEMVTDASTAAILTQLTVPFATILGVVILGERVGVWRTAGLTLAFLGVMVMMFEPRVFNDILGVLLLVCSALSYATGAVLIRRIERVGVFELQGVMALVSVPILLGLSYVFESGQATQVANMTVRGWGALLYTAIMASVVGHGLSYFLFQRNPVSAVAPYFLLTPIFGVLMSVILLDEVLTVRLIAGALITFAGVALVTFRERQKVLVKDAA